MNCLGDFILEFKVVFYLGSVLYKHSNITREKQSTPPHSMRGGGDNKTCQMLDVELKSRKEFWMMQSVLNVPTSRGKKIKSAFLKQSIISTLCVT